MQNEVDSLKKTKKRYSIGEEFFNSITHGIGIGLAIAGLTITVIKAVLNGGDAIEVASACIYGTTLIIMYFSSTLYHAIQNEKAKKILRIFDHHSIYLLIAGTYTPYMLVTLRNTTIGKVLFIVIWACALLGIILNSIDLTKYRKVSTVLYLIMGWAVVVAIKPLRENLASQGVILLFSGGIVYTVGVIFYALKKYKFMHSIWHLFVLGGSILHFLSIVLYVY